MKQLVSTIGDRLQALFPPNRVAVLLAGTITALSGTISAWLAAHAPGLNLGRPEVAAVLIAAVLITVRLLDRWFDQWQQGEPIDVHADLENAFDEIVEGHQAIDHLLGSAAGVKAAVEALHGRIARGEINEVEIGDELRRIFLALPEPLEAKVSSPAPATATPPTAAAAGE